jgi:hypothetical protein
MGSIGDSLLTPYYLFAIFVLLKKVYAKKSFHEGDKASNKVTDTGFNAPLLNRYKILNDKELMEELI